MRTERGRYQASRLVLGPEDWVGELLADYGVPITIQRQVVYCARVHGRRAVRGLRC